MLRSPVSATVSLALFSLLAACGGGGGSGGAVGPTATVTSTVDGAVIKGPVSGGQVCAFVLSGGVTADSLGCTSTDAQGNFRLTVAAAGVPVLLEATLDKGSYEDEYTGATLPLRSRLRSVQRVEPNATVTGYITPFTEIAVRRAATASTGLTQASVDDAMNLVARAYGLSDLRRERPADPTRGTSWASGSAGARKQGLALAAVSAMVSQQITTAAQPALQGTLQALSTTAFMPDLASGVQATYLAAVRAFAASARNATGLSADAAVALIPTDLALLGTAFGTLPVVPPFNPTTVVPPVTVGGDGPVCLATVSTASGNLASGSYTYCLRKVEAAACNATAQGTRIAAQKYAQVLAALGPVNTSYNAGSTCGVSGVSEIIDL